MPSPDTEVKRKAEIVPSPEALAFADEVMGFLGRTIPPIVHRAVAEERARCVAVARSYAAKANELGSDAQVRAAMSIAEVIEGATSER